MPDINALLIAVPTFIVAYAIFAVVGFGTTLISAPIVVQVVPLPVLVPAQALLDLTASVGNGIRLRHNISRREVGRLVPAMIAGLILGSYVLVAAPLRLLVVLLGLFVVLFALRGMFGRPADTRLDAKWAWWYGVAGGGLSALFGAGV